MALVFVPSNIADAPWQLWTPEPADAAYGANFYTPREPFLRKRVTITEMSLADAAERRERSAGYVTFPELATDVQLFWAESDPRWLAGDVLRHLEER